MKAPALPPLFFVLVGMWPCCACTLALLEHAALRVAVCLLVFGVVGCVVFACLLAIVGIQRILLACLGAMLGLSCASSAAWSLLNQMDYVASRGPQTYTVQVVEDLALSDFGYSAIGRVHPEEGPSFRVRLSISNKSNVACWSLFSTTTSIHRPSVQAASYYWRHACVGSLSPYRVSGVRPGGLLGALSDFREQGLAVYEGESEAACFLQSIVFGSRQNLFESSFYGKVRRVGLAHIVAVSGAHLSITVAACGFLLSLCRLPKTGIVLLQILICIMFVLLTGAPHSAIRACIMALCTLAAYFGKRRSFSLNALSCAVIAFLVADPFVALSVSLVLSACATLGIILFSEYLSQWILALTGGHGEKVSNLLGMTLAAIVFTVPVSASLFGQFSFIAPFANLLAAPFFVLLCVGGMLCAILGMAGWQLPALFTLKCAALFCNMVDALASIPYAATAVSISPVAIGALAVFGLVALFLFWPTPTRRRTLLACLISLILAALCLIALPRAHGSEIIMLDVGQGDAFVLRSAEKAILIDTGNQDTRVLQALARHHIVHLDAVVITHPDDDHCGSLLSIFDFVEVDRILVAQDLFVCPCDNCSLLREATEGLPVFGVEEGSLLHWGSFEARVLSPAHFIDDGGNADSIVLFVAIDADGDTIADATGLFCGDAEEETLERLEKDGMLAPVDILKVGHHGSKNAFTASLIDTLAPRIALISVGANNRYGHPSYEVLNILEDAHVAVFRSDVNGDVVCKMEKEAIQVQSLR